MAWVCIQEIGQKLFMYDDIVKINGILSFIVLHASTISLSIKKKEIYSVLIVIRFLLI